MRLIIVLFLFISACSSPSQLGLLTSTKCEDYSYGKIEASRILTDEEKSSLTKKGIYVQQSSNVIFNTFGELQEGELSEFGKLIKQNQGFFRMEINNARIPDLLEFPCLKSISILREMPIPDIKDSVQSEKIIKDIKDN